MNLKRFFTASLLLFCILCSSAQDKPELDIGGALRFNYNLSSWKDGQKDRGGDFGYDVFRLNAIASFKGLNLNAEYRLYSNSFGGGMLKQGWVGYNFKELNNLQIGLTQVPFGITPYNSHSWFFSINYYVGLEDDYDMGIKFIHKGETLEYAFAFFKNAEELDFGSYSDLSDSRYAYDISSKDLDGDGNLDLRNKEVNQFNGHILFKMGTDQVRHRIGSSVQVGGVQNLDTKQIGLQYAVAGHYELKVRRFDAKAQVTYYNIKPKNPADEPTNITAMTAYGYPYFVASEAATYTLGVGYNFPVAWGPVSNILIYDDFGYMHKMEETFRETVMNVAGALITAHNVYTYIDFAAGKNMPWINADFDHSLAQGSLTNPNWELRFNINIGYYF